VHHSWCGHRHFHAAAQILQELGLGKHLVDCSTFGYVIMPFLALFIFAPRFHQIYAQTPAKDLAMIYLFGLIQGSGAYVMIYTCTIIGMALGFTLNMSCIALFSLLIPLFGAHIDRVMKLDGITLLIGAALLIISFVLGGQAGLARERQQPTDEKKSSAKLRLNIPLLAAGILWSGLANSMYYFTFEFQQSMKATAINQFGVKNFAWGFLNMFPFFAGMFTLNMLLMLIKMIRQGTFKNFWAASGLGREYLLGIAMSLMWYTGQGVAFPAAQAIMGTSGRSCRRRAANRDDHGCFEHRRYSTGEWNGVPTKAKRKLYWSIGMMIIATVVVAVGNYLQQQTSASVQAKIPDSTAPRSILQAIDPPIIAPHDKRP